MSVRITSAAQSVAREAAAFAAGVDSFALMRAAGEGTAALLLRRIPELRERGAVVFTGTGNNGGDAWVVAGALARAGCPVSIDALGEPKSDDAKRARAEANPMPEHVHLPFRSSQGDAADVAPPHPDRGGLAQEEQLKAVGVCWATR